MRKSAEVDQAVALLVGNELWGFITPAYVSPTRVRAITARSQPYYAVPTQWMALPVFPQTRNGKVDKRALRALAEDYLINGTPPSSPASTSTNSFSYPVTPSLETRDSWSSPTTTDIGTPSTCSKSDNVYAKLLMNEESDHNNEPPPLPFKTLHPAKRSSSSASIRPRFLAFT